MLIRTIPAVLVALTGILAGCRAPAEDLTNRQRQRAAEVGGEAARALVSTLMSHLTQAMQEGGSIHAVEFCSVNALSLTNAAATAAGEGLSIKRTSTRVRNPANAPDEAEREALRHFQAALAETGELPQTYVQRVDPGEVRYYQAITVAPPCLTCHGGTIDPALAERLAAIYPDDEATGYEVGDFRGLIRVSMPVEALAP